MCVKKALRSLLVSVPPSLAGRSPRKDKATPRSLKRVGNHADYSDAQQIARQTDLDALKVISLVTT